MVVQWVKVYPNFFLANPFELNQSSTGLIKRRSWIPSLVKLSLGKYQSIYASNHFQLDVTERQI